MQDVARQAQDAENAGRRQRVVVEFGAVNDGDPQPGLGTGLGELDVAATTQASEDRAGLLGGLGIAMARAQIVGLVRMPFLGAAAPTGSSASGPALCRYSSRSVFRLSERGPKMACRLLPTVTTPAAPSALSRAGSALPMSATSTRRRVMQASIPRILLLPPKARTSALAKSSATAALTSAMSFGLAAGRLEVEANDQRAEGEVVNRSEDRTQDAGQGRA